MDKTNSAFEFNQNEQHEPSASSDKVWLTLPMEPATPKEWESLFGVKSLAESDMSQLLAQHRDKMNEEIKMQLNCLLNCLCKQFNAKLQPSTEEAFQNIRQELDKAYNEKLFKLQNENEILRKKLETLQLNAQTS